MNLQQEHLRKELLKGYQFRFACKEFDETRTIPEDIFEVILETGRLSPSSFGLEPWKFLVIQNPQLREKIKKISWGVQSKLPAASHFLLFLTRTEQDLSGFSTYIRKEILENTQNLGHDFSDAKAQKIDAYLKDDLEAITPRALRDWAARQVYIPIGNMMTTAALFGIDSCPIEGFTQKGVNQLLEEYDLLENGRFSATCMVAFGYRKKDPPRPKTRRPATEVIQWIE